MELCCYPWLKGCGDGEDDDGIVTLYARGAAVTSSHRLASDLTSQCDQITADLKQTESSNICYPCNQMALQIYEPNTIVEY